MKIIFTPDRKQFDVDTNAGAKDYINWFFIRHGANSTLFDAVEKLYKSATANTRVQDTAISLLSTFIPLVQEKDEAPWIATVKKKAIKYVKELTTPR